MTTAASQLIRQMRGHSPHRWRARRTRSIPALLLCLAGCASAPEARLPHVPALSPVVEPVPKRESLTQSSTSSDGEPATLDSKGRLTFGKPIFSGDSLSGPTLSACPGAFAPAEFVLGASQACILTGGHADAVLTVPPSSDEGFAQVTIHCTGSCSQVTQLVGAEGTVVATIDGAPIWQASCTSDAGCDELAFGDTPTLTFRGSSKDPQQFRIDASGVVFPVSSIEVEWLGTPKGTRGIAYSPYRDCQRPHLGPFPTIADIREDLAILRHSANAIRTYSSTGIEGRIPGVAEELGLQVAVGAWLGPDLESNEREIEAVIALARGPNVESVIVGNEVLLRKDLTEGQLINYIRRVKNAVSVPVTTAEIGVHLAGHPRLLSVLDYHLVHYYAYWEGRPIEGGAVHVVESYEAFKSDAAQGKRVVIGETGWPADGPTKGSASPSQANQRTFLREFLTLAEARGIEFYYFSAFDELWKTEGGVGPFWGLASADRISKYDVRSAVASLTDNVQQPQEELAQRQFSLEGSSALAPVSENPVTQRFPVFLNFNNERNHFAPGGWMGDQEAIDFDDCWQDGDAWADRVISIRYSPSSTDADGWAGIYWLEPDRNWGTDPNGGTDLRGFAAVTFRARSEPSGAQARFIVGGVTGRYPDSVQPTRTVNGADPDGFVTVTNDWRQYRFDLRGADMSRVIGGFGWVAERQRTPNGARFFLDDIVYVEDHAKAPRGDDSNPERRIYTGRSLSAGYDLGVETSERQRDWVTDENGALRLDYPAGQSWGAVWFYHQSPQGLERQGFDYSTYSTLEIELRGAQGGEVVHVGLKDSKDRDDGRETKLRVKLTQNWMRCRFPLSRFSTADLENLYIPAEIVFEPRTPSRTVFVRNVLYSNIPASSVTCTSIRPGL